MSFTASIDEIVAENSNGLLGARPHWGRVRLGDVVSILNGYPFDSAKFSGDRGFPLLRIRDIVPGRTNTFTTETADETYIVNPGDLVVGMDGDFNASPWRGQAAFLNQRVCKLTPDETRYSRKFLAHVLPGYLQAINANTPSITVKHLSSKTIADIPLPNPPIEEQLEIANRIEEQLSRLEAGIAALLAARAKLEFLNRSVVARATRAPQSGPKRDGWTKTTIGATCTVGTGATPKRGSAEYYAGGTIPWITSAALNQDTVTEASELVTEIALKKTNLTLYPPGTLLVAMYGEGKTRGKVSELAISATTNQAIAALQCDPSIRPFVKIGLMSRYEEMRRMASGGVQPNLNLSLIRSIPIELPHIEEQANIVANVERNLALTESLESEITSALDDSMRLRRSILHRAFAPSQGTSPCPSK